MKEGIVQLTVIRNAPHYRLTVGTLKIQHLDVFRMRVNDPGETVIPAAIALFVLVFRDQNTIIGGKGIVANSLDHLDRIVIEDGLAR
jgi:hypothetical protein